MRFCTYLKSNFEIVLLSSLIVIMSNFPQIFNPSVQLSYSILTDLDYMTCNICC